MLVISSTTSRSSVLELPKCHCDSYDLESCAAVLFGFSFLLFSRECSVMKNFRQVEMFSFQNPRTRSTIVVLWRKLEWRTLVRLVVGRSRLTGILLIRFPLQWFKSMGFTEMQRNWEWVYAKVPLVVRFMECTLLYRFNSSSHKWFSFLFECKVISYWIVCFWNGNKEPDKDADFGT